MKRQQWLLGVVLIAALLVSGLKFLQPQASQPAHFAHSSAPAIHSHTIAGSKPGSGGGNV